MLPDGYSYKELPLPNYTVGAKGANRGLVSATNNSAANLGDAWQGGNDNGGATGGGGGGGLFVVSVVWDDVNGNLDVTYSDGSVNSIAFADCPV